MVAMQYLYYKMWCKGKAKAVIDADCRRIFVNV